MTKKLLKALFTTFIISVVLNIAITSIYYATTLKGQFDSYKSALQLITSGAFLLNIILFLMVSPVLFLSLPHIRNNIFMKLLLCFVGPIVFIITSCFMQISPLNKLFYLETGLVFLTVHTISYFKTIKKIN